jgi:Fe-Mn family superoxide dismutase
MWAQFHRAGSTPALAAGVFLGKSPRRQLAHLLHCVTTRESRNPGCNDTQEVDAMQTLPELPYGLDALEPHISRETMDYHYGKHHRGYVDKLNALIQDTDFEPMSLEAIIQTTGSSTGRQGSIFNNAAQAWNHTFYWQCLTPRACTPGVAASEAIHAQYGSVEEFRRQFTRTALTTFGSGWAWLVGGNDGRLEIVSTNNADTPLTGDRMPLLTCDLWEHAYYIDYRNARAEYVAAFWKVLNWDFLETNIRQYHRSMNAA